MTIEAMWHNGSEIKMKVDIATGFVTKHLSSPAGLFTTTALQCPRCKKNEFSLLQEPFSHRYVCFCANLECTIAEKNISLEKGTYAQKLKKTGAEHFQVGRAYRNAVLSKWIGSQKHHEAVSSWITNKKPFLTILGAPGTGKTFLTAAILNRLFSLREEVAYVTHRRFIEEIHHAMQEGKTQHAIIPRYSDKKFLILDDLGSANCTDWQQEMILELIDRRYSNKDKTIITTNYSKEELKARLGARTASRLLSVDNEILEFWDIDRRTDPGFDPEKFYNEGINDQ